MKRRIVVIMFGVTVIAALAVLLWRHAHRPARQARPLFGLSPAAVTSVEARWSSGKHIALHRGREGWRITAPVSAPADPTRVGAFLAALSEPVARQYATASVPLKRAGLAPARLTLRVNRQQVKLGNLNPADGLRYIQRGARVFLVADTLLPRLAAGPWQFVSTRLLPPGRRVTALRFPGRALVTGDSARRSVWRHARARQVGPLPATAPRPLHRVEVSLSSPPGTLGFAVLGCRPLRLTRPGSGLVYTFGPSAATRLLPHCARTP